MPKAHIQKISPTNRYNKPYERPTEKVTDYTEKVIDYNEKETPKYKKGKDGVYFTYGVEWDASNVNFMDNSLKDRHVVLQVPSDKYQITSERTPYYDYDPKDEMCDEDDDEKSKECNYCKYSVEAQFGVFHSFDTSELENSFSKFNEFWKNFVSKDKKISGKELNTLYLSSADNKELEFKTCDMKTKGNFINEKGNTVSYYNIIGDKGKPQMTVGVELWNVFNIFKKYDKSYKYFDSIFPAFGEDKESLTLKSFIFLLYDYAHTFFIKKDSPYIKAKFAIKLRTNPADIYHHFSKTLKERVEKFYTMVKEKYDSYLVKNMELHQRNTYDKFMLKFDPNKSELSIDEPIFKIALINLFLEKLDQIIYKPNYTYVIKKFKDTTNSLPEGVQNRTLFGIKDFNIDSIKKIYDIFFDTSFPNVRRIPYVNYQYQYIQNMLPSDNERKTIDAKLYLGKDNSLNMSGKRLDMWEWASESYVDDKGEHVDIVHLEFRNYDTLFYVSTSLVDSTTKVPFKFDYQSVYYLGWSIKQIVDSDFFRIKQE